MLAGNTIPPAANGEFTGDDLFEALTALRIALEKIGTLVLCMGARVEVFPSGMCRNMSGGRMAYVTREGCSPAATDLVDIFDRADRKQIGSVDEQLKFRDRWLQSLRQ